MWMFTRPGDSGKVAALESMRALHSAKQVTLEQRGSDVCRSTQCRFFSVGSVPWPPCRSRFSWIYSLLDVCIVFSFTLLKVSRVIFTKDRSASSIPVSESFKLLPLLAGKAPTSNLKFKWTTSPLLGLSKAWRTVSLQTPGVRISFLGFVTSARFIVFTLCIWS